MKARETGKKHLKGLSKPAEAAVFKRGVVGRRSIGRWLRLLKELGRYDESGDILRSSVNKRTVLSGVATFVLVFFLIIMGGIAELPIVSAVLGAAVLICGGFFAYSLVRRKRLKELDLANDFRVVLIPFLTLIREDVSPEDKIKLKLDMTGCSDSKIIRKGEPVQKGGKKIEETVFSDRWCHLEANLVIGSKITLDVLNLYTRYKIRYKTARGKSKQKYKWKKLVVARAGMSPVEGKFAFDHAAIDQGNGIPGLKLNKGAGGESATIKTKLKFKSAGSEPPTENIQPKDVLGMFFQLRSLLRPVAAGSQNT